MSDSIPKTKVEFLLARVERWEQTATNQSKGGKDQYYQCRAEAYADVITAIKQMLSED